MFQTVLLLTLGLGLLLGGAASWTATLGILLLLGVGTYTVTAIWRALLLAISRPVAPSTLVAPKTWPRYTVIAALYREASVASQLVERLARLDYPQDRLEGWIVLEEDDLATLEALVSTPRPPWLKVLICPAGTPKTKPRALNHALAMSRGDIVTVYDAEDEPDPLQLREAAARFMADPDRRLACLQAPLRIRPSQPGSSSPFLDRQFALEYAALFEVILPAYARLDLPFPLGGTSNHFRTAALKAVGGWDAHNVTEDADLGFRLWSAGGRIGVLSRPTHESPPGGLEHWLPQRTRWLKGYMQTFGVHTRRPWRLGWRGAWVLAMTVGQALLSAAAHAISIAWLILALLVAAIEGITPMTPIAPLLVLASGAATAWVACVIGARRAGVPCDLRDLASAPAYWSMLTLAFVHAAWRLVRQPFVWDKTEHRPDAAPSAQEA